MNQFIYQRLEGLLSTINSNYTSTIMSTSAGKGAGRANFIQLFLKETIPTNLRISTSGEITDEAGNLTGELDIVIENGMMPSWPLIGTETTRLFIPEGVAAVIEVKSDLANQWSQVLNTASKIEKIIRKFDSGIYNQSGTAVIKLPIIVESNDNFIKMPENLSQQKVPFFVVGYKGWECHETLKQKLKEGYISGILQLDKGVFVASEEFKGMPVEMGPLSLYAFIDCIHQAANIINMATTDTLKYVK